MPWYKGLWVDHVVESHDDVLAFNAAMDGALPPEASIVSEEVDPAMAESPAPPADDLTPPADPTTPEPEAPAPVDEAAPADPAPADPVPSADPAMADPVVPADAEPVALTPEQKAAELESKHSKAELAAMAEGLGIETKGMNKGQIATAIAQASAAS